MNKFRLWIVMSILMLGASSVFAEGKFCEKNNSSHSSQGDRVSAMDLREMTVGSRGTLAVEGRNGGISVKGENRSDISVRACVRAWDKDMQKAEAVVRNTTIDTASTIMAKNSDAKAKYSVSFEIKVPQSTNLNLVTHNGGISINQVRGALNFETQNGGVSLSDVDGSVKGKTTNGGIAIKLAGNRLTGEGLDVETTNGGISVSIPRNLAARVEIATTNGGLSSDFPELQMPKKSSDGTYRYQHSKKISADINGGGPKLRAVTTNGGVSINSANKVEL